MVKQPVVPVTTKGDGKFHKVAAEDVAAYKAGTIASMTASCGFVWAPIFASSTPQPTEMCKACFPSYTSVY